VQTLENHKNSVSIFRSNADAIVPEREYPFFLFFLCGNMDAGGFPYASSQEIKYHITT